MAFPAGTLVCFCRPGFLCISLGLARCSICTLAVSTWWGKRSRTHRKNIFHGVSFCSRPSWERVWPQCLEHGWETVDCRGHLSGREEKKFLSERLYSSPLHSWMSWCAGALPLLHPWSLTCIKISPAHSPLSCSFRQCSGVLHGSSRRRQRFELGCGTDQSSSRCKRIPQHPICQWWQVWKPALLHQDNIRMCPDVGECAWQHFFYSHFPLISASSMLFKVCLCFYRFGGIVSVWLEYTVFL